MFRSIIYYLYFSAVASVVAVLVLPVLAFSKPTAHRIVQLGALLVIQGLKWICKVDFQIDGLSNVDPKRTYVIAANHQSAWETLALLAYLPRSTFVLKQELLWVPILGTVIWSISPIAIRRSEGSASLKKISEQGRRLIQNSINLILFPEGTRVEGGELGRFKKGAARIAIESGCAIIPVVHNAGLCWPKNGLVKKPGKIQVNIGQPIETEGLSADALNDQLVHWMRPALAALPKC